MTKDNIKIKALTTLEEMNEVVGLQTAIWGYGDRSNPNAAFPYPDRCLFEFAESGGLVGGAFDGARLVGFSAAWIGRDKELDMTYLHSQLVGILDDYRSLGIGEKLKRHQREYAAHERIDLIKWTFDPLKTRNANLNIKKLRAVVRKYTPDYYGNLPSVFNTGLATDRFWVELYNISSRVSRHSNRKQPSVADYLCVNHPVRDSEGFMQSAPPDLTLAEIELLVEVPFDFESILAAGKLDDAKKWQADIRNIFTYYFDHGYIIDDFIITGKGAETRCFYKLNLADLETILK